MNESMFLFQITNQYLFGTFFLLCYISDGLENTKEGVTLDIE